MSSFLTLAIETSCDDTSVALVDEKGWVVAQATRHQDLSHEPFGGVVPEIAGREHFESLLPLIEKLFEKSDKQWSDVFGIAVTSRPGLVGSLIVGLVTAKTLALAHNKPFIGVHHIEGHILSAFLQETEGPSRLWTQPYIALVISGGHTQLYRVDGQGGYQTLGQTQDDAAGEAFDKFAKMMGLGYPGGVQVDRLAKTGRRDAYEFPRALIREVHFNFSFSGLKSHAQRTIAQVGAGAEVQNDLCASYQEAIVDPLMLKLEKALKKFKLRHFVITGGVSANSRVRERAAELAQKIGADYLIPPPKFCTDNAAMIGFVGALKLQKGERSGQELAPVPREELS